MCAKLVNSWDGLSLNLISAFKKSAQGLFGNKPDEKSVRAETIAKTKPEPEKPETVSTARQYSQDHDHFVMPRNPVTPEALAEAPAHLNNKDGKPLIWAYIGKDDPTRGDSRGANGLAKEVARLMGGRMVYVDKTMLDKNFKYTSSIHEAIGSLIARDGTPDMVIGTQSYDVVNIRSCRPTMIVNQINESIDQASRSRTNLVPHDLSPDILAEAGREFRKKYPALKGKLHTVLLSSFYSDSEYTAIRKLAHILAFENRSTVFFCPNRRVPEDRYKKLVQTLCSELLSLGIGDRVHVIAPTFEDIRKDYNPYRGLIAESDHMMQIGDSHSMVSEGVCTGRPLYLTQDISYYKELRAMGYVKDFTSEAQYPLPTKTLPPISITTEVAGKLVEEFDRLARLRTIGVREDADRQHHAHALECRIADKISAEMATPIKPGYSYLSPN